MTETLTDSQHTLTLFGVLVSICSLLLSLGSLGCTGTGRPFVNHVGPSTFHRQGHNMASANDQDVAIECEERKVEWWKVHEEGLPNWSTAVKKVLLVQPSSAAAERVFSLLLASFSEQQDHALSDYLQASVMLQYNNRI